MGQMSTKNIRILENLQKALLSSANSYNPEELLQNFNELERSYEPEEENFQKACAWILMCGFYWSEAEKQFQKALEINPNLSKVINNLKLLQSYKSLFQEFLQQIKF